MKFTNEITVHLDGKRLAPVVDAVQGDTARAIAISLYSGSSAWTIPSEVTQIVVRYRKGDGTGGAYDKLPNGVVAGNYTGSKVTVTLAPQVLTVPGLTEVQIALVAGPDILAAFTVYVQVQRDPSLGTVKSEDYINLDSWTLLRSQLLAKGVTTRMDVSFELGGINTSYGNDVDQSTRIRSGFFPVLGGKIGIAAPDTVKWRLVFYDSKLNCLSANQSSPAFITGSAEFKPLNPATAFARLIAGYSDDTPDNATDDPVVEDVAALAEMIAVFFPVDTESGSGPALRWYSLGDSIAQGYYSDESGLHLDADNGWCALTAKYNGWSLTNLAVGGSGYVHPATVGDGLNARDHVDTVDFSGAELVTLSFGVNDWKYNCPLGSMSDDVSAGGTLYSNMRYCIEKILADQPCAKVVVLSPVNCSAYGTKDGNWGAGYGFAAGTLEDICQAEREICAYYGIEFVDLLHGSVINRENIRALLPDGVHPALNCHRLLAAELSKKLMGVNTVAAPNGGAYFTSFADTTLDIDKAAGMVTLNAGYLFTTNGRIDVPATKLQINTESAMSLLVYDTSKSEVLSVNPAKITGSQIVIAVLSKDYPHKENANRIPGLWSVNGKVIPEYRERIGRFVTFEDCVYALDTDTDTIRVSAGYLFHKNTRTTISAVTLAWNTESAFSLLVYDYTTSAVQSINPAAFDGETMAVIAILNRLEPTNASANYVSGAFKVNGYLYGQNHEQPVYVSPSGSDSAIGDRNHPFGTINRAIQSGAKTVFVLAGTYKEAISVNRVGGELEILAKPLSNTNKDVIIDLSTELELESDSTTGLVKAEFASTEDDFIYKAFVDQTETLIYEDSFISDGYACNLWSGDTKLIPVLTLAECQATDGTWTYDGTTVYANATPGTFVLNDGASDYGIYMSYLKKVKLMGITVRHARLDAARLTGCADAEISRCVFGYSGLYNGLALENSSALVRSCEAMFNRTDGLNIHGVSTADFIDCVSHDNGDDGISHHDQSGGMIIGGEYYNNKKGGVCSPTFGSRNSINGVYIHDNGYGVYAVTSADGAYPTCNVSDCMIAGNDTGIRADRYTLNCWNVTFADNGANAQESYGGAVNIVGSSGYSLPVAKENALGGVKPVTKNNAMTLPVGVDPSGRLFTDGYTKATIDEALGNYINDVDALIGGDS